MRALTALLVAVASSAVLATAGCGLGENESDGPACSSQIFDVQDRTAPLGPPQELVSAFDEAVDQRLEVATMAEMVSRAGWSSGWDRAIYLSSGMSDAELKQVSGADLQMACFSGLPGRSSNSDLRNPYLSLFLLNGKPIQAELWTGQNPSLDFGGRMYLTPDTVFRFNPNPGVMVAE